jgi:hypothetical protein
MNTATDMLKLEETADSNLAKSDFAPFPGCGDPAGVPAWKDDTLGDGVFLFEKRKVKWWRLIQLSRVAGDCIIVPDVLHFCLRCGLLWVTRHNFGFRAVLYRLKAKFNLQAIEKEEMKVTGREHNF